MINGRGRGSKLSQLQSIEVDAENISSSDMFLDHVTGDLYSYNAAFEEWVPFANVGLHYSRAALEYNTVGRYVLKAPTYHAKALNDNRQINTSDNLEALCILKKHEYSHWLFHKCDAEFLVSCRARWDIHSFAFTGSNKIFKILAESKTSPMVIEYPNIIGVQFDVRRRYANTVLILRNFLFLKLRKLVSDEPSQICPVHRYKDIDSKNQAFYGYTYMKNGHLQELKDKQQATGNIRGLKAKEESANQTSTNRSKDYSDQGSVNSAQNFFPHSGYACKQKGPMIVERNNIASNRIHANIKTTKSNTVQDRLQSLRERASGSQRTLGSRRTLDGSRDDATIFDYVDTNDAKVEYQMNIQPRIATTRQMTAQSQAGSLLNTSSSLSSLQQPHHSGSFFSPKMSRGEVRKSIYPGLRQEYIGEESVWVALSLTTRVCLRLS